MMAAMFVPYKLKYGPEKFCWTLSSKEYLVNEIATVKEKNCLKSSKKSKISMETGYQAELDFSQTLNDEQTNYYQSMIGIPRWAVELGRIDMAVAVTVSMLYSY